MSDSPLFVALDTLDLTAAPYSVQGFSAPEPDLIDQDAEDLESQPDPDSWPHDMNDASIVTMTVRIETDTEAEALSAVNALRVAAHSGATLYARQTVQADTLSKLVDHAEAQGPFDYSTLTWAMQHDGMIEVLLTLTCYPYWVGPEVALTPATITAAPGTALVSGVRGEVPALTMLKVTHAQATTAIALGIRSAPSATFAAGVVQDYSGTSNANAKGGAVARLVTGTSYAPVTGAPALDVNDLRGRYVAWVRAAWSAGTTANSARVCSDVTGSGIAGATTVNGVVTQSPVGATLETHPFGEVSIPAAEVPSGQASSGWGAAAAQFTIADASGTYSTVGPNVVQAYQTFTPTTNMMVSSVTVRGYATGTGGSIEAIIAMAAGEPLWWSDSAAVPASESDVVLTSTYYTSVVLTAGVQYRVYMSITGQSGTGYLSKGAATAGESAHVTATGADLGYDLRLVVTGKPALGFTAHTPVQAKATSGSPNYDLDWLALIPCDECYFAATFAFAAGQGVLIDESGMRDDSTNAYLCDDSGGVGVSLLGSIDPRSPFLLRPGDNILVALGAVGDVTPGDMTVGGSYWPRYLSMSAGD